MVTTAHGRAAAERRFYSMMAMTMIVVVLIGFAPSFYLRGLVHYPRPNPSLSPLVLLHGSAFTLWLLVFWAQTALVAAGRRDLHIQLGAAGMVLAVLLIPLMYAVAVGQVPRANQPPFATPLGWTAVPLLTIPPYAVLVWLGWRRRREAQAHKRLMLSAALILMPPATARFPLAPPIFVGNLMLELLSLLMFLPLFWWDMRTLGRIHWATKLGAGLAAAWIILSNLLLLTPGWEAVAARLPRV